MSQRDLNYYLKLAQSQIRHRANELASQPSPHAPKLSRLRLLEELIKEQIPHEDPSSSARTPR